jgi:citrate lyase beta subunit
MNTVLPRAMLSKISTRLKRSSGEASARTSITEGKRQPVSTVYGGAHLFRSDTAPRLGKIALLAVEEFAPDAATFRDAIGLPAERSEVIYGRVLEKLKREPVEDFRLDFEDGYGNRPAAEEDGHAESAAVEVARGLSSGQLPPYIGIRIKPLNPELHARSIRTLELFMGSLLKSSKGKLPVNFVVTLPKITSVAQIEALVEIFEALESKLSLRPRALEMELMIETTESIFNDRGECALPEMLAACDGRCRGAHFGTYDYTAARGITAAHQHMMHAACDFAREIMQITCAGTGVWLSDGATNILPVPIHRVSKSGGSITTEQSEDNRAAVRRAWRLHFGHIQHSLVNAFYQGWDLHPAQLVTRYAAVYEFFLSGLEAASERLRNFIAKAAQATLVGEVFDDAATGQGLLNFFLKAIHAGALTEEEARERTGLTADELRSASFVKILGNRKN